MAPEGPAPGPTEEPSNNNRDQGTTPFKLPTSWGVPVLAPPAVKPARVLEWEAGLVGLSAFLSQPQPTWLVTGLLDSGLSFIVGGSNVGKTFVAVDLACHLALGWSWHGHEVPEPRSVLYLACEDGPGVAVRLQAWIDTHDLGVEQLALLEANLMPSDITPLFVDPEDREAFAVVAGRYDVSVIDTAPDTTAGLNENSKLDMDMLLGTMNRHVKSGGSAVLIAHPPGSGDDPEIWRPRGIGTQTAKANTILQVRLKDPERKSGQIAVIARKQKHAQKDGGHLVFDRVEVEVRTAHIQASTLVLRPADDQRLADGVVAPLGPGSSRPDWENPIKIAQALAFRFGERLPTNVQVRQPAVRRDLAKLSGWSQSPTRDSVLETLTRLRRGSLVWPGTAAAVASE